jgi:hypothetical protein
MTARSKPRNFNTAGPCNPADHYMLPPTERLKGAHLKRYIEDKLYWVLHAPRQTGKTTFLQSWMGEINAQGGYAASYVSVERVRAAVVPEKVMPGICEAIQDSAKWSNLPVPEIPPITPNSQLIGILQNWAALVPKPLVVLFDEVDTMRGESLLSFLSQLRDGYRVRAPGVFPVSVALVGMRDLRDYLITLKDGAQPNPGSPFNIKEKSITIDNFSRNDLARLFAQRTAETGQQISQEALDYTYEQSRGQPWLVNRIFKTVTRDMFDDDPSRNVALSHVQEAREQMIQDRETHLDSLAYRLEDPGVRHVIDILLSGSVEPGLFENRSFQLCEDLGLVATYDGETQVANPIYREVLARQMTYSAQQAIPKPAFRWERPDGTLDMDALLREFQAFWRRHSELWEQTAKYTEAFPHLLLMAFLQRVTNSGGRIEREYASGRGRMDQCIEYGGKRHILEIKLLRDHDSPDTIRAEGLLQIRAYRDTAAPGASAHLLIFDRRSPAQKLPWDQRLTWQTEGDIQILGG